MTTVCNFIAGAVVTVLLIGCSDGGGGSPKPRSPQQGIFSDSAVTGLRFETRSLTGVTDDEGMFRYREGEAVSFFLGDIPLGSAPGAAVVTPLALLGSASIEALRASGRMPALTNRLILLQSLDLDGDADNGIQLSHLPSGLGGPVDFEQPVDTFRQNVLRKVVIEHDGRVVTPRSALNHFLTTNQMTTTVKLPVMDVFTAFGSREPETIVEYQHDLNGRVVEIRIGDLTEDINYNSAGDVVSIISDGIIESRSYSQNPLEVRVVREKSGVVVSDVTSRFDNLLNRTYSRSQVDLTSGGAGISFYDRYYLDLNQQLAGFAGAIAPVNALPLPVDSAVLRPGIINPNQTFPVPFSIRLTASVFEEALIYDESGVLTQSTTTSSITLIAGQNGAPTTSVSRVVTDFAEGQPLVTTRTSDQEPVVTSVRTYLYGTGGLTGCVDDTQSLPLFPPVGDVEYEEPVSTRLLDELDELLGEDFRCRNGLELDEFFTVTDSGRERRTITGRYESTFGLFSRSITLEGDRVIAIETQIPFRTNLVTSRREFFYEDSMELSRIDDYSNGELVATRQRTFETRVLDQLP